MENISKRLVDKSIEAFIMGLEIYNKPTIRYREAGFNQYVLNLIMDFYDIKSDKKYAYEHVIGKQRSYTYSQQFIDFIVLEVEKNPDTFVESLKNRK